MLCLSKKYNQFEKAIKHSGNRLKPVHCMRAAHIVLDRPIVNADTIRIVENKLLVKNF